MNRTDIKLLELLQKNSRVTISDLSKELSLSRPSVSERMLRLQEKGIIVEFTARLSLQALGMDTLLFIQVSELKKKPAEFEQQIMEENSIIECHRVTGTTNYILKAATSNMAKMSELIDRLIPFGTLTTSIVLSSPIPYKIVLPEEDVVRENCLL
ncbi:Lrp/AsnC family transcriptional regulator [Sporosarcina sp. GW1-11]|uniref:Lrp/AsnC family transcriptional regulator n=1 Tax=Sporosarcina sp. GW1-11 TaxID=2899126 RepID=UPI00294E420D|nr:Lrp/AsnC family transcriptional regulator [Sporosarcina sp. GW1-11]MDV6376961.1 Lrp/AsnC family transcriptional regulator [Sporosarcina sp. GW1-11]